MSRERCLVGVLIVSLVIILLVCSLKIAVEGRQPLKVVRGDNDRIGLCEQWLQAANRDRLLFAFPRQSRYSLFGGTHEPNDAPMRLPPTSLQRHGSRDTGIERSFQMNHLPVIPMPNEMSVISARVGACIRPRRAFRCLKNLTPKIRKFISLDIQTVPYLAYVGSGLSASAAGVAEFRLLAPRAMKK
ncbi:hypothetical protein KC350_g47 [Hortaea werneckii]|nr:hypothetical protein KC350_g47 [Hortaea werneckii]